MITYTCPNCDAEMASPDAMAGQRETCPACGNVTRVPGPVAPPAGVVSASPPPPPPVPSAPARSRGAESTLWRGQPSHVLYIPAYILAGLLFMSGVLLAMVTAAAAGAIMALPAGLLVLFIVLDRKCTKYSVTDRHVVCVHGILSRSSNEVPINKVHEIRTQQGIFERMFGIGSIGFSSAAGPHVEVAFKGIPGHEQVRQLVQERMET